MTTTFHALGVPSDLCSDLRARGIDEPFPIQVATIADGLEGLDVCGRAPTGSGKTIAFGIPLVVDLDRARPRRPRALVLAPTRELAEQINEELRLLARAGGQRVVAVYGGVGYGPQRKALERGVEVVVACPGRLEDLLEQGALRLDQVERVVVDEADRMADMGFLPSVKRILDACAPDRQTLLFSATLDGAVDELIRRYQKDPVRHDVTGPDDTGDVVHSVREVDPNDRVSVAAEIISAYGPTIVFCRTRHGVDRLVKRLGRDGVKAVPIHGGRSQGQRTRALETFTSGHATALVATDVAARGIHVDDVACVLHYDPAGDRDDYTHRSGRTGRAGAEGTVITMVTPDLRRATYKELRRWDIELVDAADLPTPTPRPARTPKRTPDVAARRSDERPERSARSQRKHGSERNRVRKDRPDRAASKGRRDATAPSSRDRRTIKADGEQRGTVKFFDRKRGFGFIEHGEHGDVFVHHTHLKGLRSGDLRGGEAVSFLIGDGPNGSEARKVTLV